MTPTAHPTLLTILYDADCSLCRRCKAWLGAQKAFVKMDFVAQISDEAARRFPRLETKITPDGKPDELVVVASDGRVWRGDGAWIMILWALREYRALAVRLAKNPATRALARRAFAFLSHNRTLINKFLPESKEDALMRNMRTPEGEAFEKRVMVCALPGAAGQTMKPAVLGNGGVGALRQAYETAKGVR